MNRGAGSHAATFLLKSNSPGLHPGPGGLSHSLSPGASPQPLGYTTILICTLEFDILSQRQPSPEPFPGESCSTCTHFISASQAPRNPSPQASPHSSGSCRNVAPSLWSTAWVTVAWGAEAQISIQGKMPGQM